MRHGIPAAYYLLRSVWSAVHFAMLAALFTAVIVWCLHDGQGVRLLSGWWQTSFSIAATIFHALPFPWTD